MAKTETLCLISCNPENSKMLRRLHKPVQGLMKLIILIQSHQVLFVAGRSSKNSQKIILQQALEDGDSLSAEERREFMSLCEMRWTELSTTARRNLSERKRNAVSLIPLSDDVKKFSLYLTAEGERNASILKSDKKNVQAFSTLNSIALSKLILFNRKRQEASKILLKDWQFNKKANITSKMAGCFSEVEKGLEAGVPGVRMEG